MVQYDIIVIGAGCGGLTAAAYAVKEGKKVLILENHNSPGGFATSFVRGRFEFEAALNEFYPNIGSGGTDETHEILKDFGITEKLERLSIPAAYRLLSVSADGTKIDAEMPMGTENYINAMEANVPGSRKSMQLFFETAREITDAVNYICSTEEPFDKKMYKMLKKNYPNFISTAAYSVNEVLNAMEMPLKAREILTAYWIESGVDCNRLNFAYYAAKLYALLTLGAYIPAMRSYELSMALASYIEDNGGEIRYNSRVTRIMFNNSAAEGVVLKNGERIKCRHIICNCSPTAAFTKMMRVKDVPQSAVKRTNARVFGARSACLYLGLNRTPEDLGIKDYYTIITETADSTAQFAKMRSIEPNNMLTATCLNIVNPECSPAGTTLLTLSTLYTDNCWANVEPEDYNNEKDYIAAKLISNYEKATGIIIHNNIEELEIATPLTFSRYTASPQGVTRGYLAAGCDGMIERIATEKSDNDTPGLRFCGGWGTQLSGYAAAIASGRNTAFATFDDMLHEKTEGEK